MSDTNTQMTDDEANAAAELCKQLIGQRTHLTPQQLQCPREKSDMTPCIARDGELAVAGSRFTSWVCVGCGQDIDQLLQKEQEKHK